MNHPISGYSTVTQSPVNFKTGLKDKSIHNWKYTMLVARFKSNGFHYVLVLFLFLFRSFLSTTKAGKGANHKVHLRACIMHAMVICLYNVLAMEGERERERECTPKCVAVIPNLCLYIYIYTYTHVYIYIYLCVVYCVYTHHMYEETFWSALPIASSMTRHLQSLSRGEINWYQPQNPQRVIVWNINIVLYMIYI